MAQGTDSSILVLLVIQTVVVVLALGYSAWQTRQLGKQVRLNNIATASDQFRQLNELELRDEDARNLRNESKRGILADIYFGTFKARYLMHRARLLDKHTWQSDIDTIIDACASGAYLREEWQTRKRQYAAYFRRFMDEIIIPQAEAKARTNKSEVTGTNISV
jgi:hypothetical protein